MFVVRRIASLLVFLSLCFCGIAQREVFRSGPAPVKPIEEIKKLNGYLKAEETLKLIRSSQTPPSPEVFNLVEESLQAAKDAQRADLIGGLLCGKAVLNLQNTDTAQALHNLQLAENYLSQVTDKRFIDNVMNALAIGFLRAGNAIKAIDYNQRLLDMYEDVPENRLRRLFAFRNLSNAYSRLGKKKESVTAMQTALQYAEQTNNETLLQDTKLALAVLYANNNDHEKAFVILKNIIPSINRLPPRIAEGLYTVLADSYRQQGEYAKANEYYKKMAASSNQNLSLSGYLSLLQNAEFTNEKDSIDKYFNSIQNIAFPAQKNTPVYLYAVSKYYKLKNKESQQVASLRRAVATGKGTITSVRPSIELADYYSNKGDKDSAEYFFNTASSMTKEMKSTPIVYSEYLSSLKKHQLRFKVTDSLLSVLNTEIKVKDSLHQSNLFAITKDLETQYHVSEKEYKIKELAQQRSIDQLKLKEQQQQKWIAVLGLAAALIAFGAGAYVLYNRKKQAEKIHALQLASLTDKHTVELMQALDRAQEKERRSIADKLHDEVGAMLSVLKLNLSGTRITTSLSSEDKKLQTSLQIVDTLAGEIRNLSHTLMPVVVEKYGMIRGIKDLSTQINQAGKLQIELIVTGFDDEHSIPVHQQMHIYRITQELLNNIIKHSGAKNALVQLVEHEEAVSLIVEDNGRGLSVSENNGNGLHVLQSKIELLNGNISIESEQNNGTSFIIEIPKNTNAPLLYGKNQDNVG